MWLEMPINTSASSCFRVSGSGSRVLGLCMDTNGYIYGNIWRHMVTYMDAYIYMVIVW